MTRVKLVGLTKVYSGTEIPAVDHLDLEIDRGGLTALLGPSGSGKTTAMKMIAGVLSPTSGDILFDGESVLKIPPERRGAVMVFQNHLLFPYMSVGENVGFGLKMRRVEKKTIRKKVADMLELVQLPGAEGRHPKQLSGGQQQRVALARALIVQPNVLLLDEPLSNLDPHLRDEMRELIRNIQRQTGVTMVFVTHDQEEAVILADRIALLFDGVLQQFDFPDQFYERPLTEPIARFFGGTNFVHGVLSERLFETPIGQFVVDHPTVSAGPSLLSIRPESIEMGAAAGGENVLTGRVTSQLYLGTQTRYKVKVKEYEFQVVAEPQAIHKYAQGDEVGLLFPPERIWLLPNGGKAKKD